MLELVLVLDSLYFGTDAKSGVRIDNGDDVRSGADMVLELEMDLILSLELIQQLILELTIAL